MRPRRILTAQESAEILEQAVRQNALAVVSVHDDDRWHTFKSRFLERDPQHRYVVLDHQETHGTTPAALAVGQYVGISFRHKSRKIMFATVVEAKGRYMLEDGGAIPAIRYRWPESLTELQRRAYYRTPVPADVQVLANIWPGGAQARHSAQGHALSVVAGEAVDLSCGGTLVKLGQLNAPAWPADQTLGIELQLPDGQPPVALDAYYRGTRHDDEGNLCVAVQFVGLELCPEGRAVLQRLARCVQRFHRMLLAEELKARRARYRSSG